MKGLLTGNVVLIIGGAPGHGGQVVAEPVAACAEGSHVDERTSALVGLSQRSQCVSV
jgi:hypothetical protein